MSPPPSRPITRAYAALLKKENEKKKAFERRLMRKLIKRPFFRLLHKYAREILAMDGEVRETRSLAKRNAILNTDKHTQHE